MAAIGGRPLQYCRYHTLAAFRRMQVMLHSPKGRCYFIMLDEGVGAYHQWRPTEMPIHGIELGNQPEGSGIPM